MKLTAQQTKLLNIEFATKLNDLLAGIRAKAVAQFAYNVETNVPADIIAPDAAVEHAIRQGVVSAMSAFHHFDIDAAVNFAADILEDVNAHTESAQVRGLVGGAK